MISEVAYGQSPKTSCTFLCGTSFIRRFTQKPRQNTKFACVFCAKARKPMRAGFARLIGQNPYDKNAQ